MVMGGLRNLGLALAGALGGLFMAGTAVAAEPPLAPHDFIIKNFHFRSGETLPELKLHYYTLGQPKKDAAGHVVNAILILHGTGGSGRQFTAPQFADVLFAPGGLLDPAKYFLIMPDDIGHGASSKPSDGLHMRFPHYDYADMVEAEHAIVAELVINALKHAFPDGRDGEVVVGYAVNEAGWTLSVSDNGVGRPAASPDQRVGLGTGVIKALARQLQARVEVSDAQPGYRMALSAAAPSGAPPPSVGEPVG